MEGTDLNNRHLQKSHPNDRLMNEPRSLAENSEISAKQAPLNGECPRKSIKKRKRKYTQYLYYSGTMKLKEKAKSLVSTRTKCWF